MKYFAGLSIVALLLPFFISAPQTYAMNIETVLIGDPGNLADMRYIDSHHQNGVGSVSQSFNIGKTEVTNAQYVVFLNAVAASDLHGLYDSNMGIYPRGGIVRSGVPGNSTYAVKAPAYGGAYTYDNKPVMFVSSADAMRFTNWLHNGQPAGLQNATTTEDGAYTLNGAVSNTQLAAITRNPGARWWLPSEDEWYKAAYYDASAAVYYDHPTATDIVPNNNAPPFDTGNSANYYDDGYTTGDFTLPLTDVGAYVLSGSPYGTFDQGGNLWEWNETVVFGEVRGIRGCSYDNIPVCLHASYWSTLHPSTNSEHVGFRVATIAVPEPSPILLGLSAFGTVFRRHRLAPRASKCEPHVSVQYAQ